MEKDLANNSNIIDLALITNDSKQNLISIWLIDLTASKNHI